MADKRQWGPIGTNYEEVPQSDSDWMPPSRPMSSTHPQGSIELTEEEKELLTDLAQLTLDLVGIVEPTPFADTTNAVISVLRGDYLGAGLSGLGIIPYLGDIAKAGKIPAYMRKLGRAIDLARVDANFANALRPILRALQKLLDSIPTENLSHDVGKWIDALRKPIDGFLGTNRALKAADKLAITVDRMLIAKFGSTLNIAPAVRKNVEQVVNFMLRYGETEQKMLQVMSGIDLHSPVKVTRLLKGDRLIQYVPAPRGSRVVQADGNVVISQGGRIGAWFVKAGGGHGIPNIGLAHGARKPRHFVVTQPIEMLESRACSTMDTWTAGRRPGGAAGNLKAPNSVTTLDPVTGKDVVISAEEALKKKYQLREQQRSAVVANGGGQQLYMPPMARTNATGERALYYDRWQMYLKEVEPGRPK